MDGRRMQMPKADAEWPSESIEVPKLLHAAHTTSMSNFYSGALRVSFKMIEGFSGFYVYNNQ